MSLLWINSAGGPLILLHDEDRHDWSGAFSFTPDRAAAEIPLAQGGLAPEDDFMNPQKTDYGKACAFRDIWGVLTVDGKQAIVLGDEPAATAWLPLPGHQGGIFVRWIYADDEQGVQEHLKRVPAEGWASAGQFTVKSPYLTLFDAATPGINYAVTDYLEIELQPGLYELATLEYQPDDSTHLRLHRLTWLSTG